MLAEMLASVLAQTPGSTPPLRADEFVIAIIEPKGVDTTQTDSKSFCGDQSIEVKWITAGDTRGARSYISQILFDERPTDYRTIADINTAIRDRSVDRIVVVHCGSDQSSHGPQINIYFSRNQDATRESLSLQFLHRRLVELKGDL